MKSAMKVAQNALQSQQVRFPWIMHVKTDPLDGIGNICPGESEIL